MEKIKVNMTPNPLDVQTIHASQNDGEARQWEFELHNNGELIDTSEITEQLFFKAYKGGTEQILPENGSTPTTSPFKGDIRYPQGLLTDQEFTYRQSPTEEDGLAKIKNLYGNTLVWNQLIQNGNFADTSAWGKYLATLTVSGNVGTVTVTGRNGGASQNITVPVGHVLLFIVTAQSYTNSNTTCQIRDAVGGSVTNTHQVTLSTTKKTYALMHTVSANTSYVQIVVGHDGNESGWSGIKISNVMLFDLTQMGLDITDPSDFTSLFPLSYYSYNQGSLLSFNGNGIKTVGKNLFDINDFVKGSLSISDGILSGTASQFNTALNPRNNNGIPVTFWDNDVTISFDVWTDGNTSTSGSGLIFVLGMLDGSAENAAVFLNSQTTKTRTTYSYIASQRAKRIKSIGFSYASQGDNVWHIENFQIEFSATETTYEPYTSSTISLPISTYFPNGMKSAGNVYDELTPTKAITRIGAVDLGTLDWTKSTNYNTVRFITADNAIPLAKLPSNNTETANIKSRYKAFATNDLINNSKDGIALSSVGGISVRDSAYTSSTAEDFKSAMSGVYLYYELATPTETSFTTASLVTENAEIPLSNEDGVLIGKCTEELSAEPGFHDAKIKLSDSDGEFYSNKLQLHVERSPQ